FSTPTLQAAIKKTKTVPVVFNYVADPIAAGVGTSTTSHQANVTGSFLLSAFDEIIPVMRAYLPRVKTVGSVYSPAEVNMVVQREMMIKTLAKEGITLKTVAANSAAEVGEAAVALVAGGVDAILQLPGNLTIAAFPSIAQVAKRSKTPLF